MTLTELYQQALACVVRCRQLGEDPDRITVFVVPAGILSNFIFEARRLDIEETGNPFSPEPRPIRWVTVFADLPSTNEAG